MHLRNEEREKNSKYWDRCSRTFYLSRGTNWFIRIERRPNFEFVIVVGSVGFRRSFAANRYRVVPLICQCLPLRKALCDSICVEHFSIDCELNSNANKFSSSKKCDNSRNETVFFFFVRCRHSLLHIEYISISIICAQSYHKRIPCCWLCKQIPVCAV